MQTTDIERIRERIGPRPVLLYSPDIEDYLPMTDKGKALLLNRIERMLQAGRIKDVHLDFIDQCGPGIYLTIWKAPQEID